MTLSYLEELATDAGFREVIPCRPTLETHYPEFFADCLAKEHETDMEMPHTLIVEAVK